MTHPLELVQEKFWLNIWEPKTENPRAPVFTIAAKDKQSGETTKYPIWRDKEGKLYVGKPENVEPNVQNKPAPSVNDDDSDLPPF